MDISDFGESAGGANLGFGAGGAVSAISGVISVSFSVTGFDVGISEIDDCHGAATIKSQQATAAVGTAIPVNKRGQKRCQIGGVTVWRRIAALR